MPIDTLADPAYAATSTNTATAAPDPSRVHLTRLKQIWRSGGWPSRDDVELALIAAGWVAWTPGGAPGHETLRLTDAGVNLLAQAGQRNQRALSRHDRLAQRMARHLQGTGRLVWHELSLRAQVGPVGMAAGEVPAGELASAAVAGERLEASDAMPPLVDLLGEVPAPVRPKAVWRMARPDLFSIVDTDDESRLRPVVHEIKVSRADLLSDLRQAAKRESYQWLCGECYYVFPAGLAKPQEIPAALGLWVLHGDIETGELELLRPARYTPCTLPFAVWLALAKAAPLPAPLAAVQTRLGDARAREMPVLAATSPATPGSVAAPPWTATPTPTAAPKQTPITTPTLAPTPTAMPTAMPAAMPAATSTPVSASSAETRLRLVSPAATVAGPAPAPATDAATVTAPAPASTPSLRARRADPRRAAAR